MICTGCSITRGSRFHRRRCFSATRPIDGDRATIHAHVRAEHWLPDELTNGGPNRWLMVGFYDNQAVRTADGRHLNRVKLTSTYQENAHLMTLPLGTDPITLDL